MRSIATGSANLPALRRRDLKPITPQDGEGLALALARAHRLYAGFVNARARQTGHLFQGRFGSVALDEEHLMNSGALCRAEPGAGGARGARFRTGRIRACARIFYGRDDGLVRVGPLIDRAPRFADLIQGEADAAAFAPL
ncbi:MAG: hypothetical protein JO223_00050 [Hyphomicrobiales bacterium]|nr:hypothetical protein [Hyphomicrobiales bacterium]